MRSRIVSRQSLVASHCEGEARSNPQIPRAIEGIATLRSGQA
jgi:hypothetical protein